MKIENFERVKQLREALQEADRRINDFDHIQRPMVTDVPCVHNVKVVASHPTEYTLRVSLELPAFVIAQRLQNDRAALIEQLRAFGVEVQ